MNVNALINTESTTILNAALQPLETFNIMKAATKPMTYIELLIAKAVHLLPSDIRFDSNTRDMQVKTVPQIATSKIISRPLNECP